jgi:hypothetical protein
LRPGTEFGPTDEPAYEDKLAALGEPATLSRRQLLRSGGSGSAQLMSRWILRAAGGPVALDRHALGVGSRVDQVKRDVRAVVGE